MAELRNRTPYETYQAIIDRARTFGEIGDPQGQTIFHRLLAAGASNLPKSPQEALEFLFPPPGSTGVPAVREMMRQKIAAVEGGGSWAPDIHAMTRDPQLQNAVLSGLMSLGAARFAGPDIRAMGTTGPRQTIRSPRHSPISEGRARLLRPGRNRPNSSRGPEPRSSMPYELQREAAEREQMMMDVGMDETLVPGGTGVMEEPPGSPRANIRGALKQLNDAGLRKALDDIELQIQDLFSKGAKPEDINVRQLQTTHKILFDEAMRRANIPPRPPLMVTLPPEPPNRLGTSQRVPPIHPELMKARERVRARERRHEKKKAELQSPKEEGEKLGPLPPMKVDPIVEGWNDRRRWLRKAVAREKYQEDYHRIHEGPFGEWEAPFKLSPDKYTAAIRYKGKTYTGQNHADIFDAHPELKSMPEGMEQGFASRRTGEFVFDNEIEWDDQLNRFVRIKSNPPIEVTRPESFNDFLSHIRSMSDMELVSQAARMGEKNYAKRLAINELRRRGIIPPGTRF